MNIVYTVNGEGMGHATRSSVVIDHLVAQGHTVFIFSGGARATTYLREKFSTVAEVTGLHMVYRENRVHRMRTALKILKDARGIRHDLLLIRRSLVGFRPDIVITDFDFHGPIISTLFRVPLVSIDNVQIVNFAQIEVEREDLIDYTINLAVAKMMVPRADYYLITSFFEPQLKTRHEHGKVEIIPPLLRDAVLKTESRRGKHILIYQTADSYTKLWSILSQTNEHFVAYNVKRNISAKNVTVKKFSEKSLIHDLATAKAVIVNGGFNVITESLFFKKPILSIPIKNHFEQQINSMYLQRSGFGLSVDRLSRVTLREFISRLPLFEARLQKFHFNPSDGLKTIDRVLGELVSER